MNLLVGISADEKEVGDVFSYVSPFLARLSVAVNLEFGHGVVTVEVYFQLLIFDYRQDGLREILPLQGAVETVGKVMIGLLTFGVRVMRV